MNRTKTPRTKMLSGAAMLWAACALLASACGSKVRDYSNPNRDAAVDADDSCGAGQVLMGQAGGTATLMLDTTMTRSAPRDLGDCGNHGFDVLWAKQEVVEFVVPQGAAGQSLEVSTVNMGTPNLFNTLIQVRRACRTIPPAFDPTTMVRTCWDQPIGARSATAVRSVGAMPVTPGEHIFFVVTGYSQPAPVSMQIDQGQMRVEFTLSANAAPTLMTASATITESGVEIPVTGMDADGNALGIALTFYRGGRPLDLQGDMNIGTYSDSFFYDFNPAVSGTSITTTSTITGVVAAAGSRSMAEVLRGAAVDAVGVRIYDRFHALSNEVQATVRDVVLERACTEAPAVALVADGADYRAQISGTTPEPESPTDTGFFTPSESTANGPCTAAAQQGGRGPESTYRLVLPAGYWNVAATTVNEATTATNDLVMYLRRTCALASSQAACSDDQTTADLRPAFTAQNLSGEVTLIIEDFRGQSAFPYRIDVRLTPGTAPADAGVADAAGSDAATSDAAISDAGVDGNAADAGTDAGQDTGSN